MKTIRLLYPDYLSGGLETYYSAPIFWHTFCRRTKTSPYTRWNWHRRTAGSGR